jgi:hypothetical protein
MLLILYTNELGKMLSWNFWLIPSWLVWKVPRPLNYIKGSTGMNAI